MYLWEQCYRTRDLQGAPPAHSRLARYHALAERPSPRPSPAEVCAFEDAFHAARKRLAQLRKEVAPPEAFDDNIPFLTEPGASRAALPGIVLGSASLLHDSTLRALSRSASRPGPAHNAVVGLHDRIGYRGSPFEGTDREDSETPLAGELSDPV